MGPRRLGGSCGRGVDRPRLIRPRRCPALSAPPGRSRARRCSMPVGSGDRRRSLAAAPATESGATRPRRSASRAAGRRTTGCSRPDHPRSRRTSNSPPSSITRRRFRSSHSGSGSSPLVAWATSRSPRVRWAILAPRRISSSAVSRRDTQTRIRSRVSGVPDLDQRRRSSSSTWFATRISASSRSAVRFSIVKNLRSASSAFRGSGIDVAVDHAALQRVGRHVDELDLVRQVQEPVGHGFLLPHAGDLRDHVVQAREVLGVQGGDHGDPLGEDVEHVLPPLGPSTPRDVRVGELVDQDPLGTPRDYRLDIHLLEGRPTVGQDPWAGPPRVLRAPRSSEGARRSARSRRPRRCRAPSARCPSCSIANVLPTPGAAPR